MEGLTYTTHAEDMYQAGIRPSRPKSDERWAYMCDLLRRAFYFMIGHELTHISHGHVDYMLAKTGNAAIVEFGWNMPTEEGKLERQALEADADRRSVLSAIISAKVIHESPVPENSGWIETRRSVEDLLFDWSFAVNTFFRLFGDMRVEDVDVTVSSYPPTPLRRFMATFFAHAFVMGGWKPIEDFITTLNALKRGAIYTEIAFQFIMNQEYSGKGLEVFGPDGVEYARSIVRYWNDTLVDKLAPFAYECLPKFVELPTVP